MKSVTVRRPSPRLIAIVLLAALAASAGSAMAQGRGQQGDDRRGGESRDQRAERRALEDAVRRVERVTDGEVLSAERVQSDGRDVSRVKVVDASGRVRVYMGDPAPREREEGRTRRDDSNND